MDSSTQLDVITREGGLDRVPVVPVGRATHERWLEVHKRCIVEELLGEDGRTYLVCRNPSCKREAMRLPRDCSSTKPSLAPRIAERDRTARMREKLRRRREAKGEKTAQGEASRPCGE